MRHEGHIGLLGSCPLPFTPSPGWALLGWRPSPTCLAHVPFFLVFVGLLVGDPVMLLHCSYYIITSILFLITHGLMGNAPIPCRSTFHIFTSFGLYWPTFLLCQPISFLEFPRSIYFLFSSLTPIRLFSKSFGFPWPNYHIFTSYYFSGLLAFKPTQWIY